MGNTVGAQLRLWRQRRGLSQLELSLRAAVSARYLSCIETGKAAPSRSMVLHLADRLEVPLRVRNDLLLASGFAPSFPERELVAAALDPVRNALDRILLAHEPFPAMVLDGEWNVINANPAAVWLGSGAAPHLLEPPVNLMRLSLHPDGLAPAITNLPELRAQVIVNLSRQVARTGSPALAELYDEVRGYPGGEAETDPGESVAVPVRIRVEGHDLAFISTLTTFSRPTDVTVAELAVESYFPGDTATAEVLLARG
ncbi:helix-turn-helix domain-containing protein [Nocardia sp. NPDC127579]|uniref:helix-turn-helix domain-containing protein n=1 Tax=Nocardia sp. NPDC127579 TaxID=3345402 RepID=UPI0036325F9C